MRTARDRRTCPSRDVTDMKKSPSLARRPGLKGELDAEVYRNLLARMNRRPGHVEVTTEVGYCNFCQRPRNLRTEAHHLGTLVRTIVTCETCHRTLSSTMGVAPAPEAEPAKVEAAEPEQAVEKEKEPARAGRAPAAKKATKTASAKPAAAKKSAAAKKAATTRKAPPAKPRSTATRKTTRSK
jgi:hypothetical protein